MINNFIIIAFRNLRMRKFFAPFHILGLAVSMALCLLIILSFRNKPVSHSINDNNNSHYRIFLEPSHSGHAASYSIILLATGTAPRQEVPVLRNAENVWKNHIKIRPALNAFYGKAIDAAIAYPVISPKSLKEINVRKCLRII